MSAYASFFYASWKSIYFVKIWVKINDKKKTKVKGTLIQIWKSANIFCLHMKVICWRFALKHLLLFEICTRDICEKFVYKHSEIIEYVKS